MAATQFIEYLQTENVDLKSKLETLSTTNRELTCANEIQKTQFQIFKDEYDRRLAYMKKEITARDEKISQLAVAIDENNLSRIQSPCFSEDGEIDKLKARIDELTSERDDARHKLFKVTTELAQTKSEVKQLEEKFTTQQENDEHEKNLGNEPIGPWTHHHCVKV